MSENGCDFVINYKKESFDKKVLEITNNKGIGVVYDGVGKDTFEKSINCVRPEYKEPHVRPGPADREADWKRTEAVP